MALHTIFLVDDDPMHNQMVKDHLSKVFKANITTFSTGEDCLNNMDLKPGIIILDYNLNSKNQQAMNGIEVLKKIKAQLPDTYVIMLSGQDKIEVAVDTMKHGAYDYVIKNESAFLRTENILKNIYKNIHLAKMARVYRTATFILGAGILLIIIIAIILRLTGVSTDNIGWF